MTAIRLRIAELRAELAARHDITLDTLVNALKPGVFYDVRKLCKWGEALPLVDPQTKKVVIAQGIALTPIDKLDELTASAISEIHQGKDGSIRVKMIDKIGSVKAMARLLGMPKEQHKDSGPNDEPVEQEMWPKSTSNDHLEGLARRYGAANSAKAGEGQPQPGATTKGKRKA